MPFINVKMLSGRTVEQKKEFVDVITKEAVRILKCKPEALSIVFDEYSREDWAVAGKLYSEKD